MMDVCIPMRDEWHLTAMLLEDLAGDPVIDRLWIFDNGSKVRKSTEWLKVAEEWWLKAGGTGTLEVLRRPDVRSLYAMWNEAIWDQGSQRVAILNNDLRVPPRFLSTLDLAADIAPPDVWIVYPDWHRSCADGVGVNGVPALTRTQGTRNLGGMSGFAFVCLVDRMRTGGVPRIDERFRWLCGDGDLIQQVQLAGGTAARVEGLPVDHLEGATARNQAWTTGASRRDRELRKLKYG